MKHFCVYKTCAVSSASINFQFQEAVLQLGHFRRALRPASEIRRPALFNPSLH